MASLGLLPFIRLSVVPVTLALSLIGWSLADSGADGAHAARFLAAVAAAGAVVAVVAFTQLSE